MQKPLISLITPCYNGRRHLPPYIEGLLAQTYTNVEYIFVNDGSTDATEKCILSCRKAFEKKGWKFIYIKQENGGQASAINAGLKIFTGDYLTWIDSDDILFPGFLEEYQRFLENNQEFAFCWAKVQFVQENDLNRPVHIAERILEEGEEDKLFEDLLLSQRVPALAFCMVRREEFLKVIHNREIYAKGRSQNWQLLLPMAWHYKAGYINKILARCVVRTISSSHRPSAAEQYKRYERLEDIMIHTIQSIDMPEEKKIYYCKFAALNFYVKKKTLLQQIADQSNSR